LGRIILKCLEKQKEKRYQTAEEVLAALARGKGLPTIPPLPVRKTLTSKQITVQFTLKRPFGRSSRRGHYRRRFRRFGNNPS